jgi:hypothetical protein
MGPVFRLLSWPTARERTFLAEAGRVRSAAQYVVVEERFNRWPVPRSVLRRALGLRVSTSRVRLLVFHFLPGGL